MRNRIDKIFLSVWGLFMPLYALGDDYGTFYEKFIDPPKEYRPAPLYVWNTQVTAELINHTMEDLHEQGFGGVFVHPRPGLKNEYLSDEWFSLFQHTLNTGKKLGMNVWVYDENTFPSGFAGGHVNAEMPESYNQGGSIVLYQYNKLPENIDNTLRKISIKEKMSYNNVLVSCVKYALDNMELSPYENVELNERSIKNNQKDR